MSTANQGPSAEDAPAELVACPDCGAGVPRDDRKCWLCGRVQTPASIGARAPLPAVARTTLNIGSVMVVALFALVVFGAAQEDRTAALGLTVLTLPGFAAMLMASVRGRVRGRPLPLYEKLLVFMTSTALVITLIIGLVVAVYIAFIAWCLYAISTGQFH